MMASASKTLNFSAYPSWIDAQAVGTWAAISGATPSNGLSATNTIRSVCTVSPGAVGDTSTNGPNGVLWKWSGAWGCRSLGQFGSFGVGVGGGHSACPLNMVDRFDLATRTWSELSANQSGTYDTTFGQYPNGQPGAIHSYFQNAAFPAISGFPSGGLIVPLTAITPGTSDSTANNRIAYPHVLNFATRTWSRGDQLPNAAARTGWFGAVAGIWDSARSRYLFWSARSQGAGHFSSLNPIGSSGAQWTDYTPNYGSDGPFWNANGIEQCLVIDPVRDIMITLDWRTNSVIRYARLDTPTAAFADTNTTWTISESGSGPSNRAEGIGLDWSTTQNAAYVWRGTEAAVYKLAYTSGSVGSPGVAGSLTYAWTNVLSGSNTLTPSDGGSPNPTKIYNRFRIFDYGTRVIAVSVTNVDGPVYAFRIL